MSGRLSVRKAAGVAGNMLLLAVTLAAVVWCAVPAYRLDVDLACLAAGIGTVSIAFPLLWALSRRRLPVLLALEAGWAVTLWRLWDKLCLGEVALRCAVVNRMSKKLPSIGYIEPVAQLSDELWRRYATWWVLAVGFFYALLLSWSLCRGRRFLPVLLLTALPLVPLLCVTEAPEPAPVALLLTAWGAAALTAVPRRADRWGGALATPQALLAAGLAAAVVIRLLPSSGTAQPEWAARARTQAMDAAARLDLSRLGSELFGKTGSGSTEYVSLMGSGPGYTGRVALRIRSNAVGKHYLRGWSADVYTGARWEPLEKEQRRELEELAAGLEEHPLLRLGSAQLQYEKDNATIYTYIGPQGSESGVHEPEIQHMEVENVSAPGACVYFPYGMTAVPQDAGLFDSHLSRDAGAWTHKVEFLPVSPACVIPPPQAFSSVFVDLYSAVSRYYRGIADQKEFFAQAEAEPYRQLVYERYLQVPEGLQKQLEPWLKDTLGPELEITQYMEDILRWQDSYSIGIGNGRSDVSTQEEQRREIPGWRVYYTTLLAQLIVEYLAQTTRYDQTAAPPLEGEDYVAWFLNEQKTGYCMHYATAATMLLRMAGIPARYVSGYVVNVPASGYADVTDRAAHAWVEVWFDGLGWFPLEATPGFAGDEMGQLEPNAQDPEPSPEESGEAEPPMPEESAQASQPPSPSPSEPQASAIPQGGSDEGIGGGPGMLPGVCLALLGVGIAWLLRRCVRRRRLHGGDTNAAILYAYRLQARLERWGCPADGELRALAGKAKFSRHTITRDELAQAVRGLEERRTQTLAGLPWWKRWIGRLLL